MKSILNITVPYLTEHGIAVASFDYKMYPKYTSPDFLVDAAYAVKYISTHISEYGACRRIFVGGSSAGAYIGAFDEGGESVFGKITENFIKGVKK